MQNENRIRTSIYLLPKNLRLCDENMDMDNCKSRSEYIEKAIVFYSSYIHAEKAQEFLSSITGQTLAGIVRTTENRLARMQFKEAVELAKLTHMVAPLCDLDDEQLRRLHIRCVDEVKKINGALRLDKAVEESRGD